MILAVYELESKESCVIKVDDADISLWEIIQCIYQGLISSDNKRDVLCGVMADTLKRHSVWAIGMSLNRLIKYYTGSKIGHYGKSIATFDTNTTIVFDVVD
jgi:hypothetical protein